MSKKVIGITVGTPMNPQKVVEKHKKDTTIHVTAAEKESWNNKSNFSGSYNDLKDKPTNNIVELTQAEYDKLVQDGTVQKDVLYFITDGTSQKYIDVVDKVVMLNASLFTFKSGSVYQIDNLLVVNVVIELTGTRNAGMGVFVVGGFKPIPNQMLVAAKDGTTELYLFNVQEGTNYIYTMATISTGIYRITGTVVLE